MRVHDSACEAPSVCELTLEAHVDGEPPFSAADGDRHCEQLEDESRPDGLTSQVSPATVTSAGADAVTRRTDSGSTFRPILVLALGADPRVLKQTILSAPRQISP